MRQPDTPRAVAHHGLEEALVIGTSVRQRRSHVPQRGVEPGMISGCQIACYSTHGFLNGKMRGLSKSSARVAHLPGVTLTDTSRALCRLSATSSFSRRFRYLVKSPR